jgi:fatty aldehyde decarbonylase
MIETTDPRYGTVYRDVIGHSVTGEAIGIEHYSRMIPLTMSIEERLDLLEDAYREKQHLLGMREVADRLGLTAKADLDGYYWRQVRAAFRERADAGDLLACYIMQDIVLELFAVIMYEAVIPGSTPFAAQMVKGIAGEERTHLAHGIKAVKKAYEQDPEAVRERVAYANERVARVLSAWTRPEQCGISCGVCVDKCAKHDLPLIEIDLASVHARFMDDYGRSLREIGFPPADVTRLLAQLAA